MRTLAHNNGLHPTFHHVNVCLFVKIQLLLRVEICLTHVAGDQLITVVVISMRSLVVFAESEIQLFLSKKLDHITII